MKKSNILLVLLKLVGALILSYLLWQIIFSFFTPEADAVKEPFHGASAVLAVLTTVLVLLGLRYNAVQKMLQSTKAARSNITVYEEKEKQLLDKANRVAEKYMNYESRVLTDVTNARTQGASIRSAKQFQAQLESYPDLKANESIMALLKQIRECEDSLAYAKSTYNTRVEEYNGMIHSFPESLLRDFFRFEDVEYYCNETSDIISDEELGI